MRSHFKRFLHQIRSSLGIQPLLDELRTLNAIHKDVFVQNLLSINPKYSNPKHLAHYEYQVFAQYGEDGIINEIFKRIGTTTKQFVEIGAGNGLENNTASLLLLNWKGIWVEADANHVEIINKEFTPYISNKALQIDNSFINQDNVSSLFKHYVVPKEFDLLSIDIDGNDYWVWKSLKAYKPRVVIIEYNASFGPNIDWVLPYNPGFINAGNMCFGASLHALTQLGKQLGYTLVGCTTAGVNAFFVRNDCISKKFSGPCSSAFLFEPARYHLYQKQGHAKSYDVFNSIR